MDALKTIYIKKFLLISLDMLFEFRFYGLL